MHFVGKQNLYCLDPFSQEIIEFDRSVTRGGSLSRGRLWVEFSGWNRKDPEVTVKKTEEFRKWFNHLAGWIKRRASKNERGDYLMPGAARFAAEGGRLVQAEFSDGPAIDGWVKPDTDNLRDCGMTND